MIASKLWFVFCYRLKSITGNTSSRGNNSVENKDRVILANPKLESRNTHHTATGSGRQEDSSQHHAPNPSLPKKTGVIIIILFCCCVVAFIINFINVHTDFLDLKDFYRGYMGRRLLIIEGRLTSRTYLEYLKDRQKETLQFNNPHTQVVFTKASRRSSKKFI